MVSTDQAGHSLRTRIEVQAALNIDNSVSRVGLYGLQNEKLWCLSHTETLHLWEWVAACDEESAGVSCVSPKQALGPELPHWPCWEVALCYSLSSWHSKFVYSCACRQLVFKRDIDPLKNGSADDVGLFLF